MHGLGNFFFKLSRRMLSLASITKTYMYSSNKSWPSFNHVLVTFLNKSSPRFQNKGGLYWMSYWMQADSLQHSRFRFESELHPFSEKPFPPCVLDLILCILDTVGYDLIQHGFKTAWNLDCMNKCWLCWGSTLIGFHLHNHHYHLPNTVCTSFFHRSPSPRQENHGSGKSEEPRVTQLRRGRVKNQIQTTWLPHQWVLCHRLPLHVRSSDFALSPHTYSHRARKTWLCVTYRLTAECALSFLILTMSLWCIFHILQMRELGCMCLCMAPQQVADLGYKPTSYQTEALEPLHSVSAPLLWSCLSFPQTVLPLLCPSQHASSTKFRLA